MIRLAAVSLAIATAAAGAAVAAPADTAVRRAVVAVVDEQPLVVRGSRFLPGERVRVRVTVAGRALAATARAGRLGGFTLRFPGVSVPECGGYAVAAVGARGSVARLREPPPPCGIVIAP